jgi:hypothetical protein
MVQVRTEVSLPETQCSVVHPAHLESETQRFWISCSMDGKFKPWPARPSEASEASEAELGKREGNKDVFSSDNLEPGFTLGPSGWHSQRHLRSLRDIRFGRAGTARCALLQYGAVAKMQILTSCKHGLIWA